MSLIINGYFGKGIDMIVIHLKLCLPPIRAIKNEVENISGNDRY